MPEAEGERHFAIRFTEAAERKAAEIVVRLAEQVDEVFARAWYKQLRAAVGTLATQPHRHPVQERESRLLGLSVRRFLYRLTQGSAAYHVYYMAEEESPDGPLVTILHIRHAARRSLTHAEAREIRESL